MTRIFLTLLSTTSLGWSIDAFSSIEEFFGRQKESSGAFIEKTASRDSPFAPFSPSDSDLGDQVILVSNPAKLGIDLNLQSNVFWSNNILSAATAEQSSFFWQNHASLSWQPMLAPTLFFRTSLDFDSFLFDADDTLNFENVTLGLGLVKIIPELGNLALTARYEYQHISLDHTLLPQPAEFHRIRVSATKELLNTRRHSAFLSFGGRFDLDTDPVSAARDEYALRLGYSYALTDSIQGSLFYRVGVRNFQNIPRNDTFNLVGGDLTYRLSGACSLYASALWSHNNSDSGPFAQDYNSVQLGLGVSYQHQF